MPWQNCKICQSSFYAKPSAIRGGGGVYCSRECSGVGRRKGQHINCHQCGKDVYKQGKAFKRAEHLFCSRACSLAWHSNTYVGERHSNYKHGEYAYREVLMRTGKEKKCTICGFEEQAVIIVHHIDKNRKHNDPQNLTWLCRNCHFLVHNYVDENARLVDTIGQHGRADV